MIGLMIADLLIDWQKGEKETSDKTSVHELLDISVRPKRLLNK